MNLYHTLHHFQTLLSYFASFSNFALNFNLRRFKKGFKTVLRDTSVPVRKSPLSGSVRPPKHKGGTAVQLDMC